MHAWESIHRKLTPREHKYNHSGQAMKGNATLDYLNTGCEILRLMLQV